MQEHMILEGYRVVDWSVFQNGPLAAAMLADLGADVIHVERKDVGDLLRGSTHFFGMTAVHPAGRHVLFEEHNRNKRGLAVNLRTLEGKEIIYRLIKNSDVFITNFRSKATSKLGLDYETLCKYNPRLIYVIATSGGEKGPDANIRAFDILAAARAGMPLCTSEEPVMGTPGVADRAGALMTAYATLAALFARERFGMGQRIVCSMLGACVYLQGANLMQSFLNKQDFPSWNRHVVNNPLYNFYQTKDGKWIALAGLMESDWPIFCEAVGRAELASDPRFSTQKAIKKHREEIVPLVSEIMASKTRDEWTAIFRAYEFYFSPVNSLSELESDPQVVANDYVMTFDHPVCGEFKMPGFPFHFSKTPPKLRMPAPELGQHTEEILLEIGYTWEEVAELKDKEVI